VLLIAALPLLFANGTANAARSAESTATATPGPTGPLPVVSLLSPANGAVLPAGGVIALPVSASDSRGIVQISVYLDGLLFSQWNSPLSAGQTPANIGFAWANPVTGTYRLAVMAFDSSGLSSSTPTITVTVSAATTVTPTATPPGTVVPIPPATETPAATETPVATDTATSTETPAATETLVATATPTATETLAPTETPTSIVSPATETPAATETLSATESATPVETSTSTPGPTTTPVTMTATPASSETPAAGPTATATTAAANLTGTWTGVAQPQGYQWTAHLTNSGSNVGGDLTITRSNAPPGNQTLSGPIVSGSLSPDGGVSFRAATVGTGNGAVHIDVQFKGNLNGDTLSGNWSSTTPETGTVTLHRAQATGTMTGNQEPVLVTLLLDLQRTITRLFLG
jgi:hypothetical protein